MKIRLQNYAERFLINHKKELNKLIRKCRKHIKKRTVFIDICNNA